jgi:hypothetical protein
MVWNRTGWPQDGKIEDGREKGQSRAAGFSAVKFHPTSLVTASSIFKISPKRKFSLDMK